MKKRWFVLVRVDSGGFWYKGRYATGTPLVTRDRGEALVMCEAEAERVLEESKMWRRGVWSLREVEKQ